MISRIVRYFLLFITFIILGSAFAYCEDNPAVSKRIASDFDEIMKENLIFQAVNQKEYFSPSIKVLQAMLEELDDNQGAKFVTRNYLTQGVFDSRTKQVISAFQIESMGISPGKEFIGNFGSTTLQELRRVLRFQNKADDIISYMNKAGFVVATDDIKTSIEANPASFPGVQSKSAGEVSANNDSAGNLSPIIKKVVTTKHVIQPGETLNSIAEKYEILLDALIKDNEIANPKKIYPGQALLIKKMIEFVPESAITQREVPKSNELKPDTVNRQPAAVDEDLDTPAQKNNLDESQASARKNTPPVERIVQGYLLEGIKSIDKNSKEILLALGETRIFKNVSDIKKVALGSSDVADTLLLDPRQILVNAKNIGNTTMTIWDDKGKQELYYIIVSKKSAVVQAKVFKLKNLKLKSPSAAGEVGVRVSVVEALNIILKSILDEKNYAVFIDLNTIAVQGTTDELRRIQDVLEKIDTPIEQILITAKVAEVDKDYSNSLKALSEANGNNLTGKFSETEGGVFTYTLGSIYNTIFAQQMTALITDGRAKMLATPKILVQSGEVSRINVGESVPFIQYVDGKSAITYIESGVIGTVFPQTNFNGTITTYVQFEVSNLTAERYQGYPSVQKRKTSTVMTVKDGETIVIAGLVKEEKTESVYKVPLLGDIPFIGELFKSTSKKTRDIELIITLTQHIIK